MKKKQKIAWITDSTATLSKTFINENDIYVIPLNIIFDGKSYRENVDITAEEFYEKLAIAAELPKTSQPAIGEFVNLYNTLKEQYEYAIAIHASSALTGTYQSSLCAAEMTDFKVTSIDSKTGSFALGKMIEKGVELEKNGKTYEEIVAFLKKLPNLGKLIMSPGSLKQLHKGGRVSATQALIGSLMKLKLLISFEDGKAVLTEKIRTEKKMKKRLFEIFGEAAHLVKEASVIHGNAKELAEKWKKELQGLYPNIHFSTTMFSPVAGTHTGQGTIGLTWINE